MNPSLNSISPVDGRYHGATEPLSAYFSESAIIRYRILVEVEYFIALCNLPLPQLKGFNKKRFNELRSLYRKFEEADAAKVKAFEKVTNHDVKATEYFLRARFDELGLGSFKEFIHFGLTSQDINNTAFPLAFRDAVEEIVKPLLEQIYQALLSKAQDWKETPMLARTHGQPASPTTVGKEFYVFVERLGMQLALLETIPFSAKFGGATGNFNAHYAAYPAVDWIRFANKFVNGTLGLERCQTTTQIEHYDNMAAMFDNLSRINTILIDLDRDVWTYISMEYFRQKVRATETGSSTMPHKVNPIDFENSEGNLGIANAIFAHLSAKLPVSRLQRDLTDSTVIRNIGVPLAHTVIACKSLLKGLDKLILNEKKLTLDLENNWAVVSEAIQTILRREGYPDPYEALKTLTRGKEGINRKSLEKFINSLGIADRVKQELKQITPHNYLGIINF
ncbi:MAG TPA: adenylosuccinate lyase [Bacteroidales bacterium]|nr:adenylosuccinate lyase [Bacteroidales bacterium]HPS51775.1 adenylosuccinate lyase [Bacteroidales bacterium]